MALNEQFERITSSKEEYDRLYNSDNLYIVWAVEKNDSKLEKFINDIDSEYYNWHSALNGNTRREAKLANDDNKLLETKGYVYSVTEEQVYMFEKVALMPSMKYSYRFEKYNVNDMKAKEQEKMIEVLKEGTV